MRSAVSVVLASILLAGTVVPSHAEGLLGGLLGGGDGGLVTLSSGEASSDAVVNVGLGGGGGNLVDLSVGGSSSLATATIASGGDHGLVSTDIGLLDGAVGAKATVGGSSLVDIDVGIGGPGSAGTPVTPGLPGGPGVPGKPAVPGLSGGSQASGGSGVSCDGVPPNQIARLIQSTRIDASWVRASNVSIQRVQLCPEVSAWVSGQLSGSGMGPMLQNAVASDALISTSLSRSNYGADRVFAVKRSGAQLTVYVY